MDKDLVWLKRVPVAEMVKRGWIEASKDKKIVLDRVLKFFGIASVSQWEELWPTLAIAYRQHEKHEVFPEAVSAWLRKGELEAAKIKCGRFDKNSFKLLLSDLRALTAESPDLFIPELQQKCAAVGVAVVFLQGLPKTSVSGATRWLNKDKALIQLSARYKSNDHLWFTFSTRLDIFCFTGRRRCSLKAQTVWTAEKKLRPIGLPKKS